MKKLDLLELYKKDRPSIVDETSFAIEKIQEKINEIVEAINKMIPFTDGLEN